MAKRSSKRGSSKRGSSKSDTSAPDAGKGAATSRAQRRREEREREVDQPSAAVEWAKSLGIALILFLILRTFLVQTFVIT